MRFFSSYFFFALFCAFSMAQSCQSNKVGAPGGKSVFISEGVLKTAKWADFDYKSKLDQSLHGNMTALQEFFEFMTFVDGKERTEHGITCLEIIPVVGDNTFGTVVYNLKPKMRDMLRVQIQFAMGKTENPTLKGQQIAQLYPQTWGALNHVMPVYDDSEKRAKMTPADAGPTLLSPAAAAPGAQPAATEKTGTAKKPAETRPPDPKPNERTATPVKEKGGKN